MIKKPAVFLDRDGVINQYPGDLKYVTSTAGFFLLEGAAEAVRKLKEAGFAVFVASNQAGVSKGIYSKEALEGITARMRRELEKKGASIDGVYYCTHLQEDCCSCRKPKTGLVEQAVRDSLAAGVEIDLKGSFFVGDSIIDIQTGRQSGLTTVLVFSGREQERNRSLWQTLPHYTAEGVNAAADIILGIISGDSQCPELLRNTQICVILSTARGAKRRILKLIRSFGRLPAFLRMTKTAFRGSPLMCFLRSPQPQNDGKSVSRNRSECEADRGKKKIIIAYASAGAGHRKAAEALFNYLKRHYPGCDVRKVDVLTMSAAWFRLFYSYGYILLVKYFPFLWSLIFALTASRRRFLALPAGPMRAANRFATAGFSRYLLRESPDAVINTHFLCSEIAARLKNAGRLKAGIFTVITDFGVHPLWVSGGTDLYFAASGHTRAELLSLGVARERILVSGIPVGEEFIDYGMQRCAPSIGGYCRGGEFTILIATGSFGIGPFERIIRGLFLDVG
ncbi:MAG: HAD-IIIA family hydrolase, partial [Candidatus Omnitrophota bacterium]